ncbi:MAG: diguanylate cyclase, partial [Methylococcaceae bacterium]|nr:diguanylate cyclase [Methylococcaceae bacterium]
MNSALPIKLITNLLTFTLATFSILANATEELEKVSLQLDWKYQFQFAGFIAAKEKGFYRDVGLDVELIEYQNGIDVVKNVLEHKTNYGIGGPSVLIKNKKILPSILLATYFQESPLVLVSSNPIKSPNDLMGKRIMISKSKLANSSIARMFSHFYLNNENTNIIPPTFNIEAFIQHKVDVVAVYRTNELFELNQRDIEYNVIDPADYGYTATTNNLYTSPLEAKNHAERTRKFVEASNQGWLYALENEEELLSIIIEKYSNKKSIEALRFEAAETKKLMQIDSIDIGQINNNLRLSIVKQFKRSGLLSTDQNLAEVIVGVMFTFEQMRYLQNKKEITMCTDPDWMPFEGIIDGTHIGIVADVINKFRQQLPIPLRLIQTKSWNESILMVQSRECDILSLATSTPLRKKYLNFTSPVMSIPFVLATKHEAFFINDIKDVKDKKLGVAKGNVIAEILREKIPDINIIDVSSAHDGLVQVERGELFGYIDNLMVIANSIQKDFAGVLKVSSRLQNNLEPGIATRNDQPQLNGVFELLVKNLSKSELQLIYNKWITVKQDPIIDYSLVWKLLAGTFLLALAYVFHYLKLKKLNEELLTISITDKLTGLYNRVKTDKVILQKKSDVDRHGIDLSVILLDIDFFKHVNDTYGHITGDEILIEFSQIIKHNVRISDYVGRWGGEEFLIICPNIDINNA